MEDSNLIPLNERTKDEQRVIQVAGGKASGEARRRKRNMREVARMVLDELVPTKSAGEQEARYVIAKRLALEASKGSVKAAKLLVDWSGEAPQKQEITGTDGAPLFSTMSKEQAQRMIDDIDGQVGTDKDKGEV